MSVDMNMPQLAEHVLPFRTNVYIQGLCSKLGDEGVHDPRELVKTSKDALEMKLSTHAGFNLCELGDCMSLRSAMEKALGGGEGDRDRSGRQRSRSPGRRTRGSAGRRPSRPHRQQQRGDSPQDHHRRNHRGGGKGGGRDGAKEDAVKPDLWRAVEEGDEALVARLLQDGADPEERFQGWTPLMKAAEEDRVEIARLLLDKGVDVEAANRKGRTALSFAAAPSKRETERRDTACGVLRLLLERGADTSRKDVTRCTARDRAGREQRDEAIDIFEEFERRSG